MSEKEKIEKLFETAKDNPELALKFFVDNEVVGEDLGYLLCMIEKVEVNVFYNSPSSERWYIGEDNILEELRDQCEDSEEAKSLIDYKFDEFIEDKYNKLEVSGEIIKAIVVYLGV